MSNKKDIIFTIIITALFIILLYAVVYKVYGNRQCVEYEEQILTECQSRYSCTSKKIQVCTRHERIGD